MSTEIQEDEDGATAFAEDAEDAENPGEPGNDAAEEGSKGLRWRTDDGNRFAGASCRQGIVHRAIAATRQSQGDVLEDGRQRVTERRIDGLRHRPLIGRIAAERTMIGAVIAQGDLAG